MIFKPLRLFYLCICYCFIAISPCTASELKNEEPTKLEILVVSQFKQFCMDNVNDFTKTHIMAKTLGFKEEKNEYVSAGSNDKRWIIYDDKKSLTRINLVLKNKSCMISAITSEKNNNQEDDQTPIEHYLINTLGTDLIKRQTQGEQLTRVFDSNYLGKTSTIVLKNEIIPSKTKKGVFFYQIILTLKPY